MFVPQKRRNCHATPPPHIVPPDTFNRVEKGELVSDVADDLLRFKKLASCDLIATGSQNIRWEVDGHKKEPGAVNDPRASTGCCLSL
jgi:hypothetical protein